MTDDLKQFILVGESAGSNSAVKQIKVVVAAPPPSSSGILNVSLHVIPDTSAALTGNSFNSFSENLIICTPIY